MSIAMGGGGGGKSSLSVETLSGNWSSSCVFLPNFSDKLFTQLAKALTCGSSL